MGRDVPSRILIVDDHEDNIELLRARLEARGYRIDTAMDGEQALAHVARTTPDLILLDVMMPRIDGFEVVRRLKSDKSLPFIPIILQTALDSTEHKVEGLDAGADDYITKPINFAELEARVKSMLRIKRLQDALEAREIDRVGRYGGEEFMLLLPGTVLDAAVTFAERVRKAVEAHTFTFDGGTLQRTMSCGVAAWPHPRIEDCDALVKAADDALYVAKETGRNRVIRFDSHAFNEHTQAPPDDSHAEVDVSDRTLFATGSGDRPAGGEDRGAPT